MFSIDWRKKYGELLTSGVQFFLLWMAIKIHKRPAWIVCLSLITVISLLAWASTLRRRRAILDTPTSRIASASQGLVELYGRGEGVNPPLISPMQRLPCLWFKIEVEEASGNRWKTVDSDESDSCFVLEDGSGRCTVDVEGAEILTTRKKTVESAGRRTTEWTLLTKDFIYARGEFRTLSANSIELNTNQDIIELLAEWKQDQTSLLKRFDLNGDGKIDMDEWNLVRSAARREVEKRHRELRNRDDVNLLCRPTNGQAYLISNLDPQRLAHRYFLWAALHLTVFLTALGALAWLWKQQ